MDLGPHSAFIVAAYLVAMAVLAALVAWVWLDHRAQRRILADLEKRGVSRRSARASQAEEEQR
jgi:heme exporter protein D